ncbi:class I SAM-dependent methyltransferase [Allonocardiopsis opalescens]|uniref:Methyltransferase family protein n=1 Tax=Allonocardiopsis opalescens TaxID=1144618 RepID=A0A2T0QF25_9ACTN|nr:class I SAM-dependent methyltransferase [Allonocardiopsis opalescens]PRY02451.1 methyltransferase family protein [Allonocardiopsis opalescens]
MPTHSAQPSRPVEGGPHRHRQVAESFGADAERYDRARPGYPAELVRRIAAASPGPELLDVGCGTGISARAFQAAGCRVLGVDADARMAALARRRGLEVEIARFEEWDPAGRSFDALVSGQTWHWIDPGAGAAKAAEVLRPGGRAALFWNVFQPPPDLAAAFAAVHRRLSLGPAAELWERPVLDAYAPVFGTAADGLRGTAAFGEPEQWRFEWERPYTRDEWLDGLETAGGIGRLGPGALAELRSGLGAAIDALGGAFTMRYTAVAVTAARR